VQALVTAAGTTDVELDLRTGSRGRRGAGALAALAAAVPDAEDVHVVNNGAAALSLVATALRGEVVVARGELVEIGDGFRIPELLEASGVRLREVGATNRVSLGDYAAAIGPDTSFVLKVHPSNFVVNGLRPAWESRSWPACPCRWWRTSGQGCWRRIRGCPTSRTPPRPCAPVQRWRPRRATSSSADRSAGCCWAARSWCSGCVGTRSLGRCAWTS
jgi:hypothetical protein